MNLSPKLSDYITAKFLNMSDSAKKLLGIDHLTKNELQIELATGNTSIGEIISRQILSPIILLRAPLLGALIASFVLAMPGQTLEVYRIYAEDILLSSIALRGGMEIEEADKFVEYVFITVTIGIPIFVSALLWLTVRSLINTGLPQGPNVDYSRAGRLMKHGLPLLVGSVPIVFMLPIWLFLHPMTFFLGLQPWLAILTLIGMAFFLWLMARHLTLTFKYDWLEKELIGGGLLRWLPRLVGMAPFFATAMGLYSASRIVLVGHLWNLQPTLVWAAVIVSLFGVLFGILTLLHSYKGAPQLITGSLVFESLANGVMSRQFTRVSISLFFIIVALISTITFWYESVFLAQFIGIMPIFNIFIVTLVLFGSLLTRVFQGLGFPILSLILAMAFLWSWLDINDNHGVRLLPQKEAAITAPLDLEKAFGQWYDARADKQAYGTYPVYIVAAQGGGLYAAYHAATVLGRLQDHCPGFAQHVFAISGVSGGSLGSSIFNSLVRMRKLKQSDGAQRCSLTSSSTNFTGLLDSLYLKDFLTPLAAATLFPDFIQRLVPVPIPVFDRARALENSFEAMGMYISLVTKADNPFRQRFSDTWTPGGVSPALLLNTTDVGTGRRYVIAPFGLASANTLGADTDMRLSTAVALSARFPLLTPAGWLEKEGKKIRLVDGGYFENSGVATAMDVMTAIDTLAKARKLPIRVRTSGADSTDRQAARGPTF